MTKEPSLCHYSIEPISVLQKELAAERRHLSRLYDFENDDEEDDVLREKILDVKKRMLYIEAQIREEEEKSSIDKKIRKVRGVLRTLKTTWPHMSDSERQTVCQELIDRVVIYKDGVIDVHLKLRSYLINTENT